MKRLADETQAFMEKLRPLHIELFRVAHAIVGNLELAEYVLKKAIYEAYRRRREWRERMSFREGLYQTVRMVALSELQNIRDAGSFELDWAPPAPIGESTGEQRTLCARLARESDELVRMLTLYYACGLRLGQIGQILNKRAAKVRDGLHMFRSRLERGQRSFGNARHALEDGVEKLLVAMLQAPGEDVPDGGQILRAFERDAAAAPNPRRSWGRFVAVALCSLGALLCAALFWLVAVLMEPAVPPMEGRPFVAEQRASAPAAE